MTTTSTLTDNSEETSGRAEHFTFNADRHHGPWLQRHNHLGTDYQHPVCQRHRQLQPLRNRQRDVYVGQDDKPGRRSIARRKPGLHRLGSLNRHHHRNDQLLIDPDQHDHLGDKCHNQRRLCRRLALRNRKRLAPTTHGHRQQRPGSTPSRRRLRSPRLIRHNHVLRCSASR